VIAKYGVPPSSIPDYLALVGDAADGYPGLEGWGEKSTGSVLSIYHHLESIPPRVEDWKVQPRNARHLADELKTNFKLALLFRDLATLRTKEPNLSSPDEIRWKGPNKSFHGICERLEDGRLEDRVFEMSERQKCKVKTKKSKHTTPSNCTYNGTLAECSVLTEESID
jgi:5'-3' exonuclease